METGTGIRLGVLGPLEVTCDGRPVRLAAAKQRVTLAALLAYAGRPVSSDRLVAYLWEESPPVSARGALQTHIARLRRALGDTTGASPRNGATGVGGPVALIETVGEGYVLRADPDTLDAERFRELARQAARAGEAEDHVQESALLREALDLWRGPVLADVPSEPLRREVAPRLEEERLRLLERWFELELRAGRHEELVLRLRTATSEHPLRERLWEQLMIALRRSGRRAEALEVYHQVAGLLRDELGIDPGSGLRRLHRAVLNDDPDPHTAAERGLAPEMREEDTTSAAGTVARRGTAPQGRPAPRQLPSDIARFTGRRASLAELYGMLPEDLPDDLPDDGGDRPIIIAAIGGAGGVGKTALAVHWAHQVRGRFPDGQLHLDLRGFGPGEPVEPAAALEAMLRSLHVPADQIPDGTGARSALLRSTLAGRRMLVLLDNARDTTQVRPLLPGSACLVIVTSRNRLSGLAVHEGARHVLLGRLHAAESRELLGKILGAARVAAEAEAADELARLCGHLPLALAISAEHATRRPGVWLTDLVAQLRDEQTRLDVLGLDDDPEAGLRAVFAWSYRALAAPAARAFRLLGLHPGAEFGLGAAAALIGVPVSEARRLVDTLAGRGLLEAAGTARYRFHDLMRVYAAERAEAEEPAPGREAAVRRLLSWYLHTAGQANLVLNPEHLGLPLPPPEPSCEPYTFSSHDDALLWLESEHANLTSAARRAFELGMCDMAWLLPVALWSFFNLRKHWDSWVSSHEIALEAALLLGDGHAEAYVRISLAVAHWDRRGFGDALPHAERAVELQRDLGDRRGEGHALNTLGLIHRDLGAPERAIACHRRALAIFTDLGYRWGEGIASAGLGRAFLGLGRPRLALEHHLAALAAFRAIGNPWGEGIALTDLCLTYAELSDHEETIAWCARSLERSRETRDRNTEARTLHILGRALAATDRPAAALDAWREALEIFDELADSQAAQVRAAIAAAEKGPLMLRGGT